MGSRLYCGGLEIVLATKKELPPPPKKKSFINKLILLSYAQNQSTEPLRFQEKIISISALSQAIKRQYTFCIVCSKDIEKHFIQEYFFVSRNISFIKQALFLKLPFEQFSNSLIFKKIENKGVSFFPYLIPAGPLPEMPYY